MGDGKSINYRLSIYYFDMKENLLIIPGMLLKTSGFIELTVSVHSSFGVAKTVSMSGFSWT